jgi:hypothetical protein
LSRHTSIPVALAAGTLLFAACVDIPTGADDVLSFRFVPFPSPAVVIGDTLRDSLGVTTPIQVMAFNFQGEEIAAPEVRFSAVDRGILVDSLTGFIVGDSVRAVARIRATVAGVSGTASIAVTLRPDSVVGVNATDTLSYALADTTTHVSDPMGVKVLHLGAPGDTTVASWLVSFSIVSPADTAIAHLVNDSGIRSTLDTTDTRGVGTRRVKLNVTRLTALEDSVIVEAFVKYRGVNVRGSPARLVLHYRPK